LKTEKVTDLHKNSKLHNTSVRQAKSQSGIHYALYILVTLQFQKNQMKKLFAGYLKKLPFLENV